MDYIIEGIFNIAMFTFLIAGVIGIILATALIWFLVFLFIFKITKYIIVKLKGGE